MRSRIAHRLQTMLVAGLLAAGTAGTAHLTGILGSVEYQTIDARFSLRGEEKPKDIVVVAVDDVTFSDLKEQWPFPRSMFGKVSDGLRRAGARQLVFDVQFTEETTPREDLALYDALDRAGNVVLATSESDGQGNTRVLGGDDNLKAIGAVAAASNLPDEDEGVVRRIVHDVDGLKSLGVTVAERLGHPIPPGAFREDGTAWIDYRGGPKTFPTYSFSDVFNKRVPASAFDGKIVVIGASAPTLQDVHPTPTARRALMSGPEIQANAIATALDGLPLRDAPRPVDLIAILLISLAVPLVALRFGPFIGALSAPVTGFAYLTLAHVAFDHDLIVAVAGPLLGLTVATITSTTASFALESRERRRIAADNEILEQRVRERTAEVHATQLEIVQRLGQAVDSRDEETGEHVGRIAALAQRLALASGIDAHRAETIGRASVMHDVGKVAIPDSILRKPGRLTDEERAIMQTHTTIGARILADSSSPLIQLGEVIARTHHEKWDGTGYPAGLSAEDIPLEGRIVALCDVFDALVSRRPYKEPWTVEEALAEIADQSGRHFDPRLAELFVAMMADAVAPADLAAAA